MTTKVHIGNNAGSTDIHLIPGQNLYTGEKKLITEFGNCTVFERDLLHLAAGVYASDIAIKRNDREHFIRTIELTIEVSQIHRFTLVKNELEHALHILSRDNWTINFVKGVHSSSTNDKWEANEGAVLLFSGGLDSMAAASEFIKEGRNLILMSHNSQGNTVVDACQNNVYGELNKHYKTNPRHLHMKVYGRTKEPFTFPKDEDRENTQRTRSFLFLTLAAIVMRRCGFNRILFMAENGQFAIHLPLNAARVGPFSTHTADPEFLQLAETILQTLLDNKEFEISNPFLYMTKAEVFGLLPAKLQKAASVSATCWMISRLRKHCGYCIPCISRRIAVETHGLSFNEYETDLFRTDIGALEEGNDRKRNLVDYLEFISYFLPESHNSNQDLTLFFPELFAQSIDQNQAIGLYKRVAEQSMVVLNRYPQMKKVIG